MIDVIKVASYICNRYKEENKVNIDEMKLHKLLYFSQRESIIRTGEPMFSEDFEAWKYGPVIASIRDLYKSNSLNQIPTWEELAPFCESLDFIFQNYANKDSWSLSILAHGEYSWQNARKGYAPEDKCNKKLKLEDIRKDAERMKLRRFYFEEIVPKLKNN